MGTSSCHFTSTVDATNQGGVTNACAPRCKLNGITEIYIFLTTKAMWFELTKTNSLGHSMLPPLSSQCSSPSVLKYMITFVQHNYILRCFRSFKPSQLVLNTTSYFGSRTIHTCIPLSIAFFATLIATGP